MSNINADWMDNLTEEFKDFPIYELLIPGSHDSSAYQLGTAQLSKEGWPYWATKFQWLPFIKNFLKKWTLTQEGISYADQLNLGIRAFDLRVSYCESEDCFYFSHSFALVRTDIALREIRNFMNNHPGEVIFLFAQHDFRTKQFMNRALFDRFSGEVATIFEDLLIPETGKQLSAQYTLRYMTDAGQRVFFSCSEATRGGTVWEIPRHILNHYSFDLEEQTDAIKAYLIGIEDSPNNGSLLNSLNFCLTPDDATVNKSISDSFSCKSGKTSLRTATEEMHKAMYTILSQASLVSLSKLNIIQTDFVDEKYVQWVIDYNTIHKQRQ